MKTELELMKKQLKEKGYKEHHTSFCRLYVSRKTGAYMVPYNGKFGEGYKIYSPNWNSSRYSYVTYWVK